MSRGRANGGKLSDLRRMIAEDGPSSLDDHQLLALLVRSGGPFEEAIALSRGLLEAAGGIAGLADLTYPELSRIEGMSSAGAVNLLACFEIWSRAGAGAAPGDRLGSSADVYEAFWSLIVRERAEVFYCAMLDAKLRLIRAELISKGTLTASIVHPREAFRPAVRNAASGVIFVHNHPSGDPVPSDEDHRITGRLEEAGEVIGVPLLDHIIIGTCGSYYSFADTGALGQQMSGYRGMVLR